MADPIVIELQRLASDGKCPVDELLRKALIIATKLRIDDFRAWVQQELNGYGNRKDAPAYRVIPTRMYQVNRWRGGLVPVVFGDSEMEDLICRVPMTQAISEIQALVDRGTSFHLSVPADEAALHWRLMNGGEPMELVKEGSSVNLSGVIDAVRNTVLEWSLRLEEQGILGEGMRFTSEEKAIAMTSQNIHIGSFQGILGDVAGSTVTQSLNMSIKAGDFNSLKQQLIEAGVSADDLESLKEALDADPKPTSPSGFGPKVSAWIGTMMSKAASGAWKVTLDTAGKLIPTAIAAYYGLKG